MLGEIRLGIHRLGRHDSRAAEHLGAWATRLERAYAGRLLPVDAAVVGVWARLNRDRPLPVIDSLQAATAVVHRLTFVTRNTSDLDGVEVAMRDPFSGSRLSRRGFSSPRSSEAARFGLRRLARSSSSAVGKARSAWKPEELSGGATTISAPPRRTSFLPGWGAMRETRFLGYYTTMGIELTLERAGTLDRLRGLG